MSYERNFIQLLQICTSQNFPPFLRDIPPFNSFIKLEYSITMLGIEHCGKAFADHFDACLLGGRLFNLIS